MLDDLKQYMTSMVYAAYSFNDQNKLVDDNPEFDKWVEEHINGIMEYLNDESEKKE
jgi:hypothetical protein